MRRATEVVGAAPKGITAAEAAPKVGLTRTAALRLLESMVQAGILTKEADSKRYNLALKVFQWGSRAAARFQPVAAVRQEMAKLATEAGHQIIYSVLDKDSVVIVEATELASGPATTRPAWSRTHWSGSTTGSLLVSLCDSSSRRRLLDDLSAVESDSAWPGQDIEQLLEQFRRERFAMRMLRPGSFTLATPLLDYSGQAVAALGMIVYSDDPQDVEKLGESLRLTGVVCSSFLGYSALSHH